MGRGGGGGGGLGIWGADYGQDQFGAFSTQSVCPLSRHKIKSHGVTKLLLLEESAPMDQSVN